MIVCEVVRGACDLLALSECSPSDGHAIFSALLANERLTPDHLGISLRDAVLFVDDLRSVLQPVVREFRAMSADIDSHELIPRIPFESSGSIRSKVPIGVKCERL
jgi:hypothetical protein